MTTTNPGARAGHRSPADFGQEGGCCLAPPVSIGIAEGVHGHVKSDRKDSRHPAAVKRRALPPSGSHPFPAARVAVGVGARAESSPSEQQGQAPMPTGTACGSRHTSAARAGGLPGQSG